MDANPTKKGVGCTVQCTSLLLSKATRVTRRPEIAAVILSYFACLCTLDFELEYLKARTMKVLKILVEI